MNNGTTIEIKPAPNGWIVSKFGPPGYLSEVLGVYNTMEALQAALPKLLQVEQKETERTEG